MVLDEDSTQDKKTGWEQKKTKSSFKGDSCSDTLKGHVFMTFNESPDTATQYEKTIAALKIYVAESYDQPRYLIHLLNKLETPSVKEPADVDLETEKSALKREIFKRDVASYILARDLLINNLQAFYEVLWGQCTKPMRAQLKRNKQYTEMDDNKDCEKLLRAIKEVSHKFDSSISQYDAVDDALIKWCNLRQERNETLSEFLERFKSLLDVIEGFGLNVAMHPALYRYEGEQAGLDLDKTDEWSKNDKAKYSECRSSAREKMIAMVFLKRACKYRYGPLVQELRNRYAMTFNEYPTTLCDCYDMLLEYKLPSYEREKQPKKETGKDAQTDVTFAQVDKNGLDFVKGSDGMTRHKMDCRQCGRFGHMERHCPFSAAEIEKMKAEPARKQEKKESPEKESKEDVNMFSIRWRY